VRLFSHLLLVLILLPSGIIADRSRARSDSTAEESRTGAGPVLLDATPALGAEILDRIAVIGASASDGFGLQAVVGEGLAARRVRVGLADVIRATLADAGQQQHVMRAPTSLFFGAPDVHGARVVREATEHAPTLVIAIDYLFWYGYGDLHLKAGEMDIAPRLALLEKGLDRLDSLKGVLVVGDFPDVSAAVGGMLYAAQMPSSAALKALNERLSTWAKERDRVILFPLAELTCRLNDDQPLMIGDETWEGEAKGALLGADHLHPTIPGLIAIAHEVVHQIIRRHPAIPEERFVVGREAVRASLESILRSPEKKAS